MAQRRMFSPQIIDSDAFLDMPASSQALYFHLNMRADDDGFVGNPKKILRVVGASEDDFKILIAKRFILIFESGVIVIKHWRINNLIRKDWYKETTYIDEKNQLEVKENGSYTELNDDSLTKMQRIVNENATNRLRRLDKVSLGKVNKEIEREEKKDSSLSYLQESFLEDKEEFLTNFNCSESQLKRKAQDLYDYCQSHGKRYKNYKAFLRNAVRKDFGEKKEEDKGLQERVKATLEKYKSEEIPKDIPQQTSSFALDLLKTKRI